MELPDGNITTAIIKAPVNATYPDVEPTTEPPEPDAITEVEYPQLPSKADSEYGESIRNIHRTALNIIQLQEAAKANGKLDKIEQRKYEDNMDSLNLSAQNLARIQDDTDDYFENDSGGTLASWFERKKVNKQDKNKKEEEKKKGPNKGEDKDKEEPNDEGEEGEDGIAINLPPEDASVAEAKPVGLAVAGMNVTTYLCYLHLN